jgi:hypothetical protein
VKLHHRNHQRPEEGRFQTCPYESPFFFLRPLRSLRLNPLDPQSPPLSFSPVAGGEKLFVNFVPFVVNFLFQLLLVAA